MLLLRSDTVSVGLTQSHFRFGVNELAESTHGWYAAEDTNPAPGAIPLNTTFLLRFTLQCDASAVNNIDAEFQYRKNGGGWTQITTSTSNVKAVTPSCWANAANTTKRLSGSGTFESSSQGCTADGIAGGTQFDIVANGNGETECALQLVSADLAPNDLIEFRLTRDGGTLIDVYSVTPALQLREAVTRPRVVRGPFPFPKSIPDWIPTTASADVTVGLSGVAATVVAGALGALLAADITGTNVIAAGSLGSMSGNFAVYPEVERPKVVTGPFPFPMRAPAHAISSPDREAALVGVEATVTAGFLYPPFPLFDKLPIRGPFPFLTGSFLQFKERPREPPTTVSPDVTAGPLSSTTLTMSAGTLTPGTSVDVLGQFVAGAVGSVQTSSDGTSSLAGVSGTIGQGTLVAGIEKAITGHSATAGLGSLAASAPGEVTLSGVAGVTGLGSLTVQSETAVPVSGAGSYHRRISGKGSSSTTITGKGSIKMMTWNIDDDDAWFIGEDKILGPFTVYQQNKRTPQNITGWSVSWMMKRDLDDADVDAVLVKTTSAGITLTTPTSGILNITIADTDTDGLAAGTYYHEVKRTDAGNETVLATGTCVLQQGVHRS
jgi:hypothetical protein